MGYLQHSTDTVPEAGTLLEQIDKTSNTYPEIIDLENIFFPKIYQKHFAFMKGTSSFFKVAMKSIKYDMELPALRSQVKWKADMLWGTSVCSLNEFLLFLLLKVIH
ncbi:uncharacterized protein LOC144301134 isoform X2 [Canis aureus]